MSYYEVWCPSYKRADVAITHKLFTEEKFWYVVRESEEKKYRNLWPNLKIIPEGSVTNLVETRNWIMDRHTAPWNIQIDDDTSAINWTEKRIRRKLSPQELDDFIIEMFSLCEDADIRLWGLNVSDDPRYYRQFNPFSFKSPVLGPFFGYRDFPLRHDETLNLKEDYDLFLQAMLSYGKVLRCNFANYIVDHFGLKGGCQTYRTSAYEKQQMEALQKKWGSKIVGHNENNPDSVNMRIRI